MKVNDGCLGKSVVLLLMLSAFQPASAFSGEPRPFDLSKIPMDEGWEDTGIMAAHIAPCGENMLYMGLDDLKDGKGNVVAWKIVVRDIATGLSKSADVAKDGDYSLIGCSPDSRFLFFNQKGVESWDSLYPDILTIYDTMTMKIVTSLRHNLSLGTSQYLSPDGRYLIWRSAGELALPDWRTVKTIPLMSEPRKEFFDFAWSSDGKTIYMLTMEGVPQRLIIQDVETGARRAMELAYADKEHSGMKLLVHPGTGMVYIQAGFEGYDWPEDIRYLYMLNPTKIPDRGRALKVLPTLLGEIFAGLTFGPKNNIIFSLVPKSDVEVSSFPPEFNGLFSANLHGHVVEQISSGNDLDPAFMKVKQLLIFQREVKIPDYGWVWKYVVYRKRSANTQSLTSQK